MHVLPVRAREAAASAAAASGSGGGIFWSGSSVRSCARWRPDRNQQNNMEAKTISKGMDSKAVLDHANYFT